MSQVPARQAREAVRRWRWPVGLALLVLAAGAVIGLLQPSQQQLSLDPSSTGSGGGHALADLLTARGQPVIREIAGSTATARPGVELVTGADQLTAADLDKAARFPGDLVITDPDPAALKILAPAVTADASGQAPPGVAVPPVEAPPLCNDPLANLAGNIEAGGTVLRTGDPAAATCYPAGGGYFYVRYRQQSRTVTVLGSGEPFTNAGLGQDGDASLALNLLRGSGGQGGRGGTAITWLLPRPGAIPAGTSGGQRSFTSLVPWPAYLVLIQLAIAAALAAAWRARRLGPLVAEKLPVVVRASETVEGHGRLYTARRARDRAAGELRAAARARIAARTGQPPDSVTGSALDGPPPATDTELVALADDLDELERKVRHQ